jgi:peptidoglycan/xylan/chitin deacetylase (PgdA/CDA1 family)
MNYPNQFAITIDIEDWYHIPSVCGSPFSTYKNVDEFFLKWNGRFDYLSEPTQRVLSLLEKFRVNATFFIVADVVKHYPGLVELIVDAGHEIACHGLHHNCKIDPITKKPLMDKVTFENQTREAKKILEQVAGEKVLGYRAPNALITGGMIDSLEKLGFIYDSSVSVNTFYNKTDSSLNGVTTCPYYPQHRGLEYSPTIRNIREYPFAYFDAGIKIPTSGGPMLRFLGSSLIWQGLKQSLRRGDTIFYFHPIDISEEKFPNLGNKRPLYWLFKGRIVENRIIQILSKINKYNGDVSTLRDLRMLK